MSHLLLVLPIQVHREGGRLFVESQAHNGLSLWLKHFDYVTLACIEVAHQDCATLPLDTIRGADRLNYVSLPEAWYPHQFLAKLPSIMRLLKREIKKADYLQFGIWGLWGDWASVAALIAHRLKRPFSVWTDRVESQVHATSANFKSGLAKIYTLINAKLMQHYERALIKRATLGLFHGADCYRTYAPFCSNPQLVHNIHIGEIDHISEEQLERRLNNRPSELRVVYAGRAVEDKGVFDWISAIAKATHNGALIKATWLGDGKLLDAAKKHADDLGVSIRFTGSLPHEDVLAELKKHDVFMFCHKTLESPRCLIEALICGLPIIGYRSDYPSDLISKNGGGILTHRDDIVMLERIIVKLQKSDEIIADLSRKARLDGLPFTDEKVFEHRSFLIKCLAV
ncbi:MAG: glycosyltransferase [Rhodanobacter sp.]|jgi:glycosyltransferase involved in cell wall biosynthesis|nr:glycosyltransferase [Rhodanobacter sp.]